MRRQAAGQMTLASAVPWYVKKYNNKYYEYYGMEVVE